MVEVGITVSELAAMIDHTLLGATVTEEQLAKLCDEAIEYECGAVAISSCNVAFCAACLEGSDVKVCSTVGFPLGQALTSVKVYEAEQALDAGADEIDFVINVGMLKSGKLDYVAKEIERVVAACRGHTSKVILETCYLTDEEKRAVCKMAIHAGATYVKTSTGMGTGGATLPDVLLLKSLAQERAKVKASGGIHNLDQVLAYIDAGAERIGASRGAEIVEEARRVLPS